MEVIVRYYRILLPLTKKKYEALIRERNQLLYIEIPRVRLQLKKIRQKDDTLDNSEYDLLQEKDKQLNERLKEIDDYIQSIRKRPYN